MGAEQSNSPAPQLKSQRDEDIPYTSYSISKPIDGDSPKSSPRLSKQRATSPLARQSPAHTQQTPRDIVIVTEGASKTRDMEPELETLEKVPHFRPIIKSSVDQSSVPVLDNDMVERLDSRQVFLLCQRYQEHIKQCAEAVAFDQNALCVRIKEVDFAIQTLYSNLTERQKKFAKYAEQIQKVSEMSSVLNKVKMSVEQTVPLMERLNSVLPPEDQLPPFTMSPAQP